MPHPKTPIVRQRAEASIEDTIARLTEYLAIPAISCDPDHAADVVPMVSVLRHGWHHYCLTEGGACPWDFSMPVDLF